MWNSEFRVMFIPCTSTENNVQCTLIDSLQASKYKKESRFFSGKNIMVMIAC